MGSQSDLCFVLKEASALQGDEKCRAPAFWCSLGILVLLVTLKKGMVMTHDELGKLVVQRNPISLYLSIIREVNNAYKLGKITGRRAESSDRTWLVVGTFGRRRAGAVIPGGIEN